MPYLGVFRLEIDNNIAMFEISNPQICVITNFCKKLKLSKFDPKNSLFGLFLARILKSYCDI